jgi:hypothetical protein
MIQKVMGHMYVASPVAVAITMTTTAERSMELRLMLK